MPDLIVTDFSEKDGVISFTLKNVGTKTAPVGHTATLSVNGQQKDSVLVNVTILPDKTYTTTFKKYRWACTTSGQYTLIVMADSAKKVDEIDEKNNSRQEVWTCDATPPAITAGPAVASITQTSAKVSWTTNETSDSVVKYGVVSGQYTATESLPALVTAHTVSLDGLQADTLYYYIVESTDGSDNTVRSSQRSFRTQAEAAKRPDLIVADIWERDGEVCFRLRNAGTAAAPGGHTAALYVDGQLKVSGKITITIAAGPSGDFSFVYAWKCTKPRARGESGRRLREHDN